MTRYFLSPVAQKNGAYRSAPLGQAVKHRVLYNFSIAKMLHHYPLEQLRSHAPVPYTFRIDHHDGTSSANAKAWSFAALYSRRTEKQVLSLKEQCEERIQSATATIRRAKAASTHDNVA